MKAGMTFFFQHPEYLQEKPGQPLRTSDLEVYQRDLDLASKAESAGYDSLWTVEHHFTGYTMVPDPLQLLSFMAGRTRKIALGTAAVIMPWHNPVRVADSVAMLDNLCEGRYILGMGRGLGRIEFEGLGVSMDEARGRFIEGAEIVLDGLDRGYVEYKGQYYNVPRRAIRPAPTRPFRNRAFGAAVSPESQEIMARLGIGILIAPQKAWDVAKPEHDAYRALFETINHRSPPPPIVTCQVFVDRDPVRANEYGKQQLAYYYKTAAHHYELAKKHFDGAKGYEYYRGVSNAFEKFGDDGIAQRYADLQIYGTPDECVGKIENIRDTIGCDHFNAVFSYSGMSPEETFRNMSLWTEAVLPRIQAMASPRIVDDGSAQRSAEECEQPITGGF